MSRRRRRMLDKQRRHGRARPTRRRIAAGAGLTVGATFALGGTAHATTFEVNSNADPGPGNCDTECTLHDAIDLANANALTVDQITFASSLSGGTIQLNGDLPPITDGVYIYGPGPGSLTVDGDGYDMFVFDLTGGNPDEATISGLTVTGGADPTGGGIDNDNADLLVYDSAITNSFADFGGGISNGGDGALTLVASVLSGNHARAGGGLRNYGYARIYDSTLDGNYADIVTGQRGGAIYNYGEYASLLTFDSTISGNHAGNIGGGIYSYNADSYTDYSTISGNEATNKGGGIVARGTGTVTVNDSTISGNTAAEGGGLFQYQSAAATGFYLQYATVAGNDAAEGGGIDSASPVPPDLYSTIVADNTAGSAPDVENTVDAGFSLVENTTGAYINDTVPGSNILGVDPQLGPLADNGGPTMTRALALTSPAVDKGSRSTNPYIQYDQRGPGYLRTVDGPTIANSGAAGGDGTDIGAFEVQSLPAAPGGAAANQFSFGKLKRNLRRGTAKQTVIVPGPGTLTLRGKGLVKQRLGGAGSAVASKLVSAAGKVKLLIKSKGAKKKKLNRTGKVRVRAKFTFTPTGGTANTKAKRIKLKKKL
jgi:hypothetical protein